MTTFDRVKEHIEDQLHVRPDQVKLESHIVDELGADSLDCVELLMGMEEEFQLSIKDEDVEKCRTVQDVVDLVDRFRKT